MLAELVRKYNGLQDYHLKDGRGAIVKFSSHEHAKLALAGNYIIKYIIYIGLHKFKLDQLGTELKVSFLM
jgi:hypothetical protein